MEMEQFIVDLKNAAQIRAEQLERLPDAEVIVPLTAKRLMYEMALLLTEVRIMQVKRTVK